MAGLGISIGPCECCGSSSSTTTPTSDTTTTGTTGTGTTETTSTGTTGTTYDCCGEWDDGVSHYPVTVVLTPGASCTCGGDGTSEMLSIGDGTFETDPVILLCDDVEYEETIGVMELQLLIECPSVSSSGNWRLTWTLLHINPTCDGTTGSIDAYSVDCDGDGFAICFGPIGGIPSLECCNGGSGSGTWDICFESS